VLLLRWLWSGFRVPKCSRLPEFDNSYLRDTARPSVLLVRSEFLVAITVRWYPSDAEDGERIRALSLPDDVSGDDSIGDRTGCNGDYVEPRKVTPRVQKTRHRMKIVALKWTLRAIVSIAKEKRKLILFFQLRTAALSLLCDLG